MQDDLLDRRMRDWKQSEELARDAERAARAASEVGPGKPLAARAARLRRIADVVLQSILDDMRQNTPSTTQGAGSEQSPRIYRLS